MTSDLHHDVVFSHQTLVEASLFIKWFFILFYVALLCYDQPFSRSLKDLTLTADSQSYSCIQIEKLQRLVVIPSSLFIRKTHCLARNNYDIFIRVEMKEMSFHFYKCWRICFSSLFSLPYRSIDLEHVCNASKGNISLRNTHSQTSIYAPNWLQLQ